MILKSLELQGFKTFPDKTTLKFERGITSVVGPNGSGKSNISDAMRWVLGEQSVRTLRCSKMEDVIFNGTPQRKALGFAEVTLTIDNSDRGLPFAGDTVAVTRRYYRSGESEYLINKNTVRLKDINELFMDTGLGRDGYSIIGQGKIDSIVAARSEDRREIFEEAAGISRYRYRKEESERRLDKAEENLVRLRDILSELEGRVEPLRIQAEKAEQFIAYDKEKRDLEIGIWMETLDRSGKVLREHGEKIALARAQHDGLQEELQAIAAKTEENYRQTNQCTVDMEEARSQAAALDGEAVRAEGEASLYENDAAHTRESIQRLEGQIAEASRSGEDTDREIQEKREEILEKKARIQESRDKMLSYTQRLEELRRGADQATRDMEQAAQELAQYNASLAEERIKLSSTQSSMAEIRLRAGAVADSVRQANQRLADAQEEAAQLKEMLADAEQAVAARDNAVKGYELRVESRRKRAQAAREEWNKLTLDVSEQQRRAKLLEDMERNLEGFSQSVKQVMKAAGRGMLSGICGPVSQLLKTPGEYAVALETALGASMQHIVVETEPDAKSAIRLLKQRDWGRATFLPLSTIRGSVYDPRDIRDMAGFVGMANTLCACEERYYTIRDSLLGRVAVAEDLDSATAIARKTGYRLRVVSLDGQVVNAGGSLTGGSRGRSSGLLSRASEIQRVREKAAALQKQADAAQQEFHQRQEEFSASEAELDAARGELASAQEERIRIQSQSVQVARELEQLSENAANLEREQSDSAGRLAELSGQEQTIRQAIAQLEEQVARAQEKSQELSGSREEQMARCDDISQTIQEIRMGEFSAQKDRDALEAAVAGLESRKQDAAGTIQRLEEEIAVLREKIGELDVQKADALKRAAQLKEQAQLKRESLQTLSQQRAALEQESQKLRERERDAISQRENVGQELSRLQERSENLQKEYDQILTKLWEEYELTRREAEEMTQKIEDLPGAQRRLAELKNKIKALGAVNVGAVVEYKEVAQRYEFLKGQIEDVEKSKAELQDLIQDLTKHMRQQFSERFAQINQNFGQIFRELFGGGAAELSFTDDSDVLTSGIEIRVHPPGKIVTHIESLSGGEKALVAISIYFAIMRVNPPPFCVLDEIEAALDEVNVARFAQYLRRMSGNTQFITITHRRGTMEGSDMLYGVTMQDQGISKLLALHTDEAAEFGT
ncbi:MAG: chromosome segregation protein SMC [Acutalibacter sp.]|jgi:chromosome segregation protein